MHHEGSFHIDGVRHLSDDEALRAVLNLKHLPQASTLGNWLRKMGHHPDVLKFWTLVNKVILSSALYKRKGITLDIDATEIIAISSKLCGLTKRTRATCRWLGIYPKPVK